MSVKIIVDSTADLLPHIAKQVKIVPLTIRFGDREFVDGVTIDSKKFYEMLIESDELPTTSQANPAVFEEAGVRPRDEPSVESEAQKHRKRPGQAEGAVQDSLTRPKFATFRCPYARHNFVLYLARKG